MTDECKQFDSFLIDLAYGELSDGQAEALRLHAAQCATCRRELEEIMLVRKMAAQLPPLEPADSMNAVLLDAATTAADRHEKKEGSQPDLETSGPGLPLVSADSEPSFLERLRAFLLTPALATAAVVALVFVISFFLVQQGPLHEKQAHKGGQIASETPVPKAGRMVLPDKDEAKESASATDDESLNEEMAPLKRPSGKSRERHTSPTRAAPKSTLKRGDSVGNGQIRTSPPGSIDGPDYLGSADPDPATTKRKKTAMIKSGSSASRAEDKKQLRGMVDDSPNGVALEEVEAENVSDVHRAMQAPAEPSKQNLPGLTPSNFRIGTEAYARGDCKTATSAFLQVVNQPSAHPSQTAHAIHHIGACEKRRGRCGKAIGWYEKLFNDYPNYKHRAKALWEASSCYRLLGQLKRAQAILEQLTHMPGWEAKATRELEQLYR